MTREEKIEFLIRNGASANLVKTAPEDALDNCLIAVYGYTPEEVHGNDNASNFDVVSRPKHYANTSIECIDAMVETQGVEAVKAFCVCNAFKYLWRHNEKNGDEDIKKASWYLNKAVELMGRSQHEN